jgi:hypothetical protein
MEFKTSDLLGDDLDCAVVLCKPISLFIAAGLDVGNKVCPTVDFAQCQAIVDGANLVLEIDGNYLASKRLEDGTLVSPQRGQTQTVAFLRCFVHSHFGDRINIPDLMLLPRNQAQEAAVPPIPKAEPFKPVFSDIPPEVVDAEDRSYNLFDHADEDRVLILKETLQSMIDATGRHPKVPIQEARNKAIDALAKVEKMNTQRPWDPSPKPLFWSRLIRLFMK